MSSKAVRRRRQRELRRERELEDGLAELAPDDVSCADADLAQLTALLGDVFEILHELASAAASTRRQWPADPDLGDLDVMLEELRGGALACRDRLGTIHDRVQRFRGRGDHFHLIGGRLVRMVPVEMHTQAGRADEDIPF